MIENNTYFQKFPIINYNNNLGINILRRVNLNSNVKNFYSAFYPYTLEQGEKLEHVSFNYYQEIEYDWILYHVNDIIDPFYDVNLSDVDFNKFIKKKYNTERNSIRRIKDYRSNWKSDDTILSTSSYLNLPASRKKYWNSIENAYGTVAYVRSNTEFIVSTNKIESFELTNSTNGNFVKDEVIVRNDQTESIAQISWSNTTSIVIQHVRGDFTSNTNYTITGETSGITATVNANSYNLLNQVIPEEETVYYEPFSYYTDEIEKNEEKRDIYLIRKQYIETLNEQLTEILQ